MRIIAEGGLSGKVRRTIQPSCHESHFLCGKLKFDTLEVGS